MEHRKKLMAIINPFSGNKGKDMLPKLIEEVIDHSRFDVEIALVTREQRVSDLAAMAVEKNFYGVIAVGGDGTVNGAASAVKDSDTALAIIPCGSGNGLARHLEIPMNMRKALEVINRDHVEVCDYCMVNDETFVCTCGMGFDATVSYKFSNEGTRGFITYIKTALTEYIKYKPQEYIIDIDGMRMKEKAFVIACCNAAQYGNNAYIAPRATMQDGMLDLTVMHPFNFVESPLIGARLFLRQLGHDNHVSIYRGKRVTIERSHDDILHIDGDPVMMPARVVIENVRRGINILVPPTLPDDV